MQRLFTMFPAGLPGFALVLLRIGVTGSVWGPTLGNGLQNVVALLGLGVISVLLLVGFATPLAASAAAAVQLTTTLDRMQAGVLSPAEVLTLVIHGASALALALLGPGAFSIDARLFGRKILTSSRPGSR